MGKATIRRRLTSKRKVNRKNKKTQRKGKKQSGGRRRPDGPGTAGGNNHIMYDESYLNTVEKAEAIALIQADNLEVLRVLLDGRSFRDHEALMVAVTMSEPNIDIISEVISKTPINSDTEIEISDAIYENSALLTDVLNILHEEEERREEARRLQEQEQKYANNGRPSTPLPRTMNDEY